MFPTSFSIKVQKRFSNSSLHKDFNVETNDSSLANENWVVIKPKRRQGPDLGKHGQGNVKDHIVGNQEKDTKGKEQGHSKEETASKPPEAPHPVKSIKGQKMSSWDNYSAPGGSKLGEHTHWSSTPTLQHFVAGLS